MGFAYRHGQRIVSYTTEEESPSTAIISYLCILGDGQGLVGPLVQPPPSLEGMLGGSVLSGSFLIGVPTAAMILDDNCPVMPRGHNSTAGWLLKSHHKYLWQSLRTHRFPGKLEKDLGVGLPAPRGRSHRASEMAALP